MEYNNIECADVIEWAAGYTGEKFHAMLCDPPYDYAFMGKDWDDAVAMQAGTWAALAEHLLPGGFIMAFGGARTYHRLACALEDAGLVIHSALGWLNGQGFPKATRVDTQIDKAAGAEREVVGREDGRSRYDGSKRKEREKFTGVWNNGEIGGNTAHDITAPATPLAAQWEGHRYGLQAIKPALEFIALAQKPYEGKPVESIVETGAGALNIDGGRIGLDGIENHKTPARSGLGNHGIYGKSTVDELTGKDLVRYDSKGRWPANFALCHSLGCVRDGVRRVKGITGTRAGSQDVGIIKQAPRGSGEKTGYADADGRETVANWQCVKGCAIAVLGQQSGELKSGKPGTMRKCINDSAAYGAESRSPGTPMTGYGDKGSPARFYHNSDWSYEVAERLAASDAVRYQAKAGRKERDAGLDSIQMKQRDPSRHIGQPSMNNGEGNPYNRGVKPVRNSHPTVKPIALTKWLATLLLPPDAYAPRRILIPFAGSGSEAIGAMLAGWEHIALVEMNSDYCDIARARLAWWTEQANGQMWPNVKEILKSAK